MGKKRQNFMVEGEHLANLFRNYFPVGNGALANNVFCNESNNRAYQVEFSSDRFNNGVGAKYVLNVCSDNCACIFSEEGAKVTNFTIFDRIDFNGLISRIDSFEEAQKSHDINELNRNRKKELEFQLAYLENK